MFIRHTLLRNRVPELVDLTGYSNTNIKNIEYKSEYPQENIEYLTSIYPSNMSSTFYNCDRIADWSWLNRMKTKYVTSMSSCFEGCCYISDVPYDLTLWDTSNVISMSDMFRFNYSCTGINVSTWDVSKVTNFDYMFSQCDSITSLDLSNWDTKSATSMNGIFYHLSKCKVLDISNFDTRNISSQPTLKWPGFSYTPLTYLIIGSRIFKMDKIPANSYYLNTTCKILVPSALLNTYKTATNWSSRASQFDAIENYTIKRSNGQVTVTPKS